VFESGQLSAVLPSEQVAEFAAILVVDLLPQQLVLFVAQLNGVVELLELRLHLLLQVLVKLGVLVFDCRSVKVAWSWERNLQLRVVAQSLLVFFAKVTILDLLQFLPLRNLHNVVMGASVAQCVLYRLEQRYDF